jgi:glycerol-3-phosphate acyltransferase PlsY
MLTDGVLVVAAVVVGYLIGTFPAAVVVTRFATRGVVDIRQAGSGNPGGFNTLREVGKTWGAVVILLDGAKAVIAAAIGWLIGDDAGAYAAATAVIAGHIAPVWTRFRGGKGVATAGGAILAVFPVYFPIHALVLVVGALGFRNSTRAMQAAAAVWVVASVVWFAADWPNGWGPDPTAGLVIFSALGAAMILAKFRLARRVVVS